METTGRGCYFFKIFSQFLQNVYSTSAYRYIMLMIPMCTSPASDNSENKLRMFTFPVFQYLTNLNQYSVQILFCQVDFPLSSKVIKKCMIYVSHNQGR